MVRGSNHEAALVKSPAAFSPAPVPRRCGAGLELERAPARLHAARATPTHRGEPAAPLYWLLGSSVQKQAVRDGEGSSSPACKHRRVGVQSDIVDSILMLERRYSYVMEQLLLWRVF